MAISWSNINNGEGALSIRNKINDFNASVVVDVNSGATSINTNSTNIATNVTNIATNTTNIGTNTTDIATNAADIAVLQAVTHMEGFIDYNDLFTATTPIVVPGTSTFVDITNDGLGPNTLKTYLPTGMTDIWNTSTNLFFWTDLKLGDMVDIRLDLEVITTTANQVVEVVLELATGGTPYDIPFAANLFKAAGTYKINRYNGIYMGNLDTLNNNAKFKIKSDAPATLRVNGWYCKIITY